MGIKSLQGPTANVDPYLIARDAPAGRAASGSIADTSVTGAGLRSLYTTYDPLALSSVDYSLEKIANSSNPEDDLFVFKRDVMNKAFGSRASFNAYHDDVAALREGLDAIEQRLQGMDTENGEYSLQVPSNIRYFLDNPAKSDVDRGIQHAVFRGDGKLGRGALTFAAECLTNASAPGATPLTQEDADAANARIAELAGQLPELEASVEQAMKDALSDALVKPTPEERSFADSFLAFFGGRSAKTPPTRRPTRDLPRFDVDKFWDADSTPPALAQVSRAVGSWLPNSGARTPTIEAGIVMASLMHDVFYYYGGTEAQKNEADALFGDQIPYFVSKLDESVECSSKVTAFVDELAVGFGGGPSDKSYAWSYGVEPEKRNFAPLEPGEEQNIQKIAQETFVNVVHQIAAGEFETSGLLKDKLAQLPEEYQVALKEKVVSLANVLDAELSSLARSQVPGFRA